RILWSQPRNFLRRAVNLWDYTWQLGQIVAADRIIAISHSTKRDLLRFFPHLDPCKIVVTHLACDPIFAPAPSSPAALARLGITKPFLLYAGSIDFRKNLRGLLVAYEEIRHAGYDVQLVLIGQDFSEETIGQFPEIQRRLLTSPFCQDIVRPGFVATPDLAGLYSSALALVFPSLYEGFGLPVLEAMACGCPVVAYRTSSIPEVVGSAGFLLGQSDDLAAAVARVIRDPVVRAKASEAGLQQAGKFSWVTTAAATVRVLQEAAAAAR
ncbi:MAG: glycosyltransferase family 4 protein, partial [bacterium]